jgi:hypothetical protein
MKKLLFVIATTLIASTALAKTTLKVFMGRLPLAMRVTTLVP